MKAVVQRVLSARVEVSGGTVGEIGRGLLVLLGVEQDDTAEDAAYLADKCVDLRIFEDDSGKLNLSLQETGGGLLAVSNFTVCGDCRHGRRPNFMSAAAPAKACELYRLFTAQCARRGLPAQTGVFGADMQVHLVNDGPVTVLLDTGHRKKQPAG